MKKQSLWRMVALLLVVALLLAACGGDDDDNGNGGEASDNLTPVVTQVNWIDDVEWAGFYLADERGYFADAGIEHELRLVFDDAGDFLDPITEVAEGRAQFGVADMTTILTARAAGQPVVAVATVYQRHPLALTSLAENEITQPEDLVGKTVEVSGVSTVVFQALLASEDIALSSVNVVDRTDYSLQPLLSGEADVIDAWVTSEVVELTLEDIDFNMILASDYGIEVYPAVIFTREDLIADQHDMVQGYVNAVLHGYQDGYQEPDAVVDIVAELPTERSREMHDESMQRSRPLMKPSGSEVGMMSPDVWEFAQEILLAQELLSEPLDLEEAYTLEFLNSYYQ